VIAARVGSSAKLVIFGTGSLSQLLEFSLREDPRHEVVAFTSTADKLAGNSFLGRPLVPFEQVAENYPPSDHSMFVAVGYDKMNRVRSHFYSEARKRGYELITHVSPNATIHPAVTSIGDNCCIFAGATIEPFVSIGNDVIVWSGAHVSHHSSIGDHAFLAPQATVAGHTSVGRYCFLGANSTVRDSVSIGDDCLVGAGATILGDTSPRQVYVAERTRPYSGDPRRFFD
jgi:sugar O-acyltransferase (sialic acid O-acetyltransferase NeuD family)